MDLDIAHGREAAADGDRLVVLEVGADGLEQIGERHGVHVGLAKSRDDVLRGGNNSKYVLAAWIVAPALEHFRENIRVLLPYARAGYDIVVPEPTCGMMLKKEYADYLQGEERLQAYEVAGSVFDLSEYLMKLNAEGRLVKNFPVSVGRVAYHQPCHLKYQAIGQKSIELLRLAGAEVIFIDKGCSGHDGTWAMKKQYFDLSQKVAGKLHRGVRESHADLVATDCSLAGLQIQQGAGRTTLHPIEVLAKAYGIEEEERIRNTRK